MAENEPVGTVVGVFQAQDPDGDSLSYHLVSGTGRRKQQPVCNGCEWDPDHRCPVDYESYQSLSIRVAAMDELNASVEGAFTVFITDQNETAPNQAPVGLYNVGSLEVAENEPIGTFVGTFQAQDPDGDALSYHLVSGLGDGNNSLFLMDANGTLTTDAQFDYESGTSRLAYVYRMDEQNASVEDEFVVSVTEPIGNGAGYTLHSFRRKLQFSFLSV